ncbi:MAG: hypothetical protein JWO41_713 [Candidatus Saccharibacteria bacterium]|nr:hypothetical protein [Candidatus Saccharibacteria bacterium]
MVAPLVAEQRAQTEHMLRVIWECQAAGISPSEHKEAIYAEAERRRLCREPLDLPQLSLRELSGDPSQIYDMASFANPETLLNPNLAYQAALLKASE